MHDSSQSLDIWQNSDRGISNFRISGQSLIKQNCPNSRTSDDVDMKLGPVTKLEKRNKTTSKKFDVNVMSENCDVIVIFWIFGQFGAVQRPVSGHRVCKTYVFSNSHFLFYKNWKQNWKFSNTANTLLLWVKVLFLRKNINILQKNADVSKIKGA